MREVETSKMLTPEMIEAVADNWDKLRELFNFQEEIIPLNRHCRCKHHRKHKDCKECCCPEFLKFNFWFSDVKIENENAECKDEDKDHRCKDDDKHHRCKDEHKRHRCEDDHRHHRCEDERKHHRCEHENKRHKCKHHRYSDEY